MNRTRFLRSLAVFMMLPILVACGAAKNQQTPPADTGKGNTTGTTTTSAAPAAADAKNIHRVATDVAAPVARRDAQKVTVDLETVEVNGHLADGTTYTYWTYNGTVPGPMVRVRVGDTVEIRIKNNEKSANPHSIDLHAVNGPGGGAVATQVKPGETKSFTFKALNTGIYVYHCASPHIPTHVAKGMYGLIIVEPAEGLPKVDREFYVMQGEIYTQGGRFDKGHMEHDGAKQLDERPTFVVFNGKALGLTGDNAMKAKVGETVRLFVGNGGPNLISNFHVIGEIFDQVYMEGAREVMHDVQTTLIPAGGAGIVEFKVDVPGRYILVDHALNRALDKGAIAFIEVEGNQQPDIFNAAGTGANH